MSAVNPTPFQMEQKQITIAKAVIFGVALAVLATFAALYRDSLFSYLKSHMEFSTILLPAAGVGVTLGLLINQLKDKKQIALALTVFLAAVAIIAHVNGLTAVQNGALALGGGLLGFFMFNAKEKAPEVDKDGKPLMSPNVEFAYGAMFGQWKEVTWEKSETYISLDPAALKANPPKIDEVIAQTQIVCGGTLTYYYRVTSVDIASGAVWGCQQLKGLYSTSQKRINEQGNTVHPIYLYDPIGKKQKIGSVAWIGILGRAGFGIAFDIVALPFYIIYLLGRLLCYDLWKSKDKMDLLGNRFFEILNVGGETIEGIGINALCGVGGTFASFGMALEGFKHGRPMIAQNIVAKIEQIQNEVGLHQSFWSIVGSQFHFKGLKGDLEMNEEQQIHLRQYGFYVLGCCQPFDFLELDQQGKAFSLKHISNPNIKGANVQVRDYNLSSREDWGANPKSYPKPSKK